MAWFNALVYWIWRRDTNRLSASGGPLIWRSSFTWGPCLSGITNIMDLSNWFEFETVITNSDIICWFVGAFPHHTAGRGDTCWSSVVKCCLHFFHTWPKQLQTVDHLVRRSMKNAANCAKHGELQGFMKPLHVERLLRPWSSDQGHILLGVSVSLPWNGFFRFLAFAHWLLDEGFGLKEVHYWWILWCIKAILSICLCFCAKTRG